MGLGDWYYSDKEYPNILYELYYLNVISLPKVHRFDRVSTYIYELKEWHINE